MTPEQTSQFITGKRVISEAILSKEIEHKLNYTFDDIQARFKHELVSRLVNEIVENRMKDVVIEEGPNFFDDTKYKLELFIFNRQELNTLIEAIKMND